MEFDDLSRRVIGCAMEGHRALGPGLLESTCSQCLAYELSLKGIAFKLQCPLPVEYKDIHLDCGYRADFFIENALIVELKSVDRLESVHEAQVLTYMKFAHASTGLLINFNVKRLTDGIKRFVL